MTVAVTFSHFYSLILSDGLVGYVGGDDQELFPHALCTGQDMLEGWVCPLAQGREAMITG